MKREYKRTLIIMGIILAILVNFLCFWIGYHNFLYPKLGNFEIKMMEEEKDVLVLTVSRCHNAIEYFVEIIKDGQKIYETTSKEERIELNDFEAEYNDKVEVKVTAKNKNGEEEKSKNTFFYLYKAATLNKEKDHLLSGTRDLTLSVLGFDYKKDYKIELQYKNAKIYEALVANEDIIIPYNVVEGYSGRITAYLKNENDRTTSSFNFYLNTPIVGKINIETPNNEYTTRWDDIEISYKGGTNANHFYINLLKEGILRERFEVEPEKNKVIVPATKLEPNSDYQILLEAVYDDFTEIGETSEIIAHIGKVEVTNGVFTSHNPTFIKKGTKVTLQTINEDATIYYTIDGSIPTTESLKYEVPISIENDTIIKTYAVSRNRLDSFVSTYDFKVKEKTPVIYLSPSNQEQNYGVQSTGFTTEMEIMNKIADVVERELKNAGLTVYRNNPNGDMNAWASVSRSVGADFHFAIHSNASSSKVARGPEIHVDNENSLAFSIASNIYENLWNIYAGHDNYSYHRGVKFSRGALGEANDQYLSCSSLIEVAFHDQIDDATWIMNNIENIGKNLASSIISYYN